MAESDRSSDTTILRAPKVPDGENLFYRIKDKDSDEIIGYRRYKISKIVEEGKECYEVNVKTESTDEEYNEVIDETSILGIDEVLRPITRRMITTVRDGKLVSDMKMNYEELDIPPNCCTSLSALALYLRSGPFDPKLTTSVNVMMADRLFVINSTTSKEKESITVPSGTYDCYKVELTPDIASLMDQLPAGFNFPQAFYTLAQRLVSRFIPSIYYWYSVDEPHIPIMYEGVEHSSSSVGEAIIEELVSE
ncbi:MAG: DUF3108 domain-containing protein [Halobacteriota archaeon]|nr:DUF3108 domain-containing protein [Halobacteriota archaeon]